MIMTMKNTLNKKEIIKVIQTENKCSKEKF